ncbi:TetR/AcrR family transcriptional regulator [Deinococcus sp. Arct2-2]|uniref:TetR/AcrR family transcriptional regulator n=1 Tax=Deinococcus sp. Arct2-2 TaxID=2568653 RepID=UPI0010A473C6|nr:TetR/AcrR family transcriptional regulator [Deinococcus sp. Arct2-2]THF67713.1 TetR/AcrR family transcriptional regulator [Deinococcus sp. Arct2-2]
MSTRPGLTQPQIIGAAAELADRVGLHQFTLKTLAEELGVRTPSLYNHVTSIEAVQRGLRVRGMQELTDRVQRSATGRSGLEALHAVATAERDFARQRPGLFAAMQRHFEHEDETLKAASHALLDTVLAVLRGYGLEGEQAIYAARATRAAVTGFVGLEAQQGFGLPTDIDQSFEWLVSMLDAGLRAMKRP